eukprot:CAMPEP_0185509444 /NCGR_PEP_ID=MMETSP1366-20130426/46840_1 /TAXON_ID=38817 /ORGANISM="Gephyrocapsa oceanica, Strain RCC1303" /LENGTH=82 /DNA_ID=CAMNT_0028119887 /DNA_START=1 /DNA_END=247 /DNA_ORIENTATION=-
MPLIGPGEALAWKWSNHPREISRAISDNLWHYRAVSDDQLANQSASQAISGDLHPPARLSANLAQSRVLYYLALEDVAQVAA